MEEEELAGVTGVLDKSHKLNENWCIKLGSCIWNLYITWRSLWHDKKQHIVLHKIKLQKLQANVVIYIKRVEDSATRLKDRVVVQDSKNYIHYAKFKAVDLFGD